MIDEYEKQKRKQIIIRRTLTDYVVGAVITLTGIFFLVRDRFDLSFNESFPPDDIDKIFGVICIIYGSWRLYRGYKKNYFR